MNNWKTLDVLQWENGWINCNSIHIHCFIYSFIHFAFHKFAEFLLICVKITWEACLRGRILGLILSLSLRYGRGSWRRDFFASLCVMPMHVVFELLCIWSFILRSDLKLNYKTRWATYGPWLFITYWVKSPASPGLGGSEGKGLGGIFPLWNSVLSCETRKSNQRMAPFPLPFSLQWFCL